MLKYALIKNNLVDSVIISMPENLTQIETQYDMIIDVTNREQPNPGDSYYADSDEFISNIAPVTEIPIDLTADYLNQGIDLGFEPFNISKYTVSYADSVVTIGCKTYPAIGILDTLHKLIVEKQPVSTYFISTPEGPSHGQFGITWDDAQLLYDALIKINFNPPIGE